MEHTKKFLMFWRMARYANLDRANNFKAFVCVLVAVGLVMFVVVVLIDSTSWIISWLGVM